MWARKVGKQRPKSVGNSLKQAAASIWLEIWGSWIREKKG